MSRLIEYIDVLKLDNFLQTLTFSERLQISQYRAQRTENVPERVEKLQQWIDKSHWKSPEFKVSQDREVLWFDLEKQAFQPLKNHPLYKQRVYI